ncbi:unnamed protein product [Heligmosomoides polygyrus]|uniref:Glycerophosphocholine acyltransferase 1 n=1 Tax=Heligmosomoides polygyrus TaxID=6339 RepID=A0A183G2E8_HELPZ|nr:unnamed protein product [Heligmosomoides polygyrus]
MESLCLILHVKNYPRQGRNTEIPSQFFALTRETAAQFLSKTFVLEWRTEKRFCRVALALIGGLKHDGFQVAGKRFGEDVDVLLSLADVLCRAYVLLVTNVKVEPANAVVPNVLYFFALNVASGFMLSAAHNVLYFVLDIKTPVIHFLHNFFTFWFMALLYALGCIPRGQLPLEEFKVPVAAKFCETMLSSSHLNPQSTGGPTEEGKGNQDSPQTHRSESSRDRLRAAEYIPRDINQQGYVELAHWGFWSSVGERTPKSTTMLSGDILNPK